MSRRTEANRLKHKKKIDQKKRRIKEAESDRKQQIKEITRKFHKENEKQSLE